jgi:uncharacterized protein
VPSTRTARPATRLTIYVAEPHRHGHRYAVTLLLERAAALGIAGGAAFTGILGFGRGHHVHEGRIVHQPDETPLTVVIVDQRPALDRLLPALHELLPHAFAVLDDVDTIRYLRDGQPRAR